MPRPPPPRVTGGGGSAAGVRYLLAGAQAWHAQAEACAGQMSAVSTGLRMAMMASGQQVDVDSVAPDAPKVTAAMEEVRRQYPPHRLTSAAMDPSFVEAVAEQSSHGTASRSSAPGGGGVRRYPPEHLSFLTTTNVILPPPPPSMGSLTDMWGTPPLNPCTVPPATSRWCQGTPTPPTCKPEGFGRDAPCHPSFSAFT